jgi:hypothetical protein
MVIERSMQCVDAWCDKQRVPMTDYCEDHQRVTIEQIKEKRIKLAADISEAVKVFQKETTCTVEAISLQHLVTAARNEPIKTNIDVKIRID